MYVAIPSIPGETPRTAAGVTGVGDGDGEGPGVGVGEGVGVGLGVGVGDADGSAVGEIGNALAPVASETVTAASATPVKVGVYR